MIDYLGEIDHVSSGSAGSRRAIDDAVKTAPATLRAVIDGLQALRGVAKLTATTIAVEVGNFSRFAHPKQLMGYGGIVPSEYSTGKSRRRERSPRRGNAHLRRVARRSSLVVSPSTRQGPGTSRRQRELPARSDRDRVEGAAPPASPVRVTSSERKTTHQGRHCDWPRAARLHLGHRRSRRARPRRAAEDEAARSMTRHREEHPEAIEYPHEGESSTTFYAAASR